MGNSVENVTITTLKSVFLKTNGPNKKKSCSSNSTHSMAIDGRSFLNSYQEGTLALIQVRKLCEKHVVFKDEKISKAS